MGKPRRNIAEAKTENRLADFKSWSEIAEKDPELAHRYQNLMMLWRDLRHLVHECENTLFNIQGGPHSLLERERVMSVIDKTQDIKPFEYLRGSLAHILTSEEMTDDEIMRLFKTYDLLGIPREET